MALPELEKPPPHGGRSCYGVEEGPKAKLRRVKAQIRRVKAQTNSASLIRLRIRRDFPGADLLDKRNCVIDHFIDH